MRKKFIEIIKNEEGFGSTFEPLIWMAFIGCWLAVLLPFCSSERERSSAVDEILSMESLAAKLKETEDLSETSSEKGKSLKALEATFGKMELEDITCPVTEKPYQLSAKGIEWKLCCPDPENHLNRGVRESCIGPGGWIRSQTDPGDLEFREYARSFFYVETSIHGPSTLTVNKKPSWRSYFIFLAGTVFVFALLYFAAGKFREYDSFVLETIHIALGVYSLAILTILLFVFFLLPYTYQIDIFADGGGERVAKYGPVPVSRSAFESKQLVSVVDFANSVTIVHRDSEGKLNYWVIKTESEGVAQKLAAMTRKRISGI